MPSVRGRSRRNVVLALGASSIAAGALVGFLAGLAIPAGIVLEGLGIGISAPLLTVVLVAVLADLVHAQSGRLRPLSINRQVPREWSSYFSAPVTAGLYGARLGVGPLTMLSTWLWWAMTIGSVLLGPMEAMAVGAAFGFARVVSLVGTSIWAEARLETSEEGMSGRFIRLQANQRRGQSAVSLAVLLALFLGACSTPADPELSGVTTSVGQAGGSGDAETPAGDGRQGSDDGKPDDDQPDDQRVPVTEPAPTRITEPDDNGDSDAGETGSDAPDASPTPSSTSTPESSDGDAPQDPLASSLVTDIAGFERITAPDVDRALDLDAAARLQPDPTEELPLLETRGFRGGWTRAFRNGARDVVVVTVYEFENPTEAAFYLEDGLITIGGYGGLFFDVPDIEGGRGFRQVQVTDDETLLSVGVTFVRESRWYLVYMVGDETTVVVESLVDAARQQAALADATG